jgi:hypothetical protein
MSTGLRKLTLTAHVGSSVGWLGAAAGCGALAVVGRTSDDEQLVRGAYLAVDVITRFVIVPLALGAVVTGLVQALGTQWGLFRHYWVAVKFIVTVVAAAVMLSSLDMVGDLADMAARHHLAPGDMAAHRTDLVVHTVGGAGMLLVPLGLSIYKPRGVTRYGRRKAAAPPTATPPSPRPTNLASQASAR